MRPAPARLKPSLVILLLGTLIAAAVAAAAIAGTSPLGVAEASDEGAAVAASPSVTEARGVPAIRSVTETWTADGLVTTTSEPEQLGVWLGLIDPTWSYAVATTEDDAVYDAVAGGLRTVYVTGAMDNEGSKDVYLARFVDGARDWQRVYDGAAHGYDVGAAVAVRGGAIYTAGRRDPSGDDTSDLLLVRWDSSGDRVWTRAYDSGSHRDDVAVDVAVDGDGNVVVAGYSITPATDWDWVVVSYRPDGTRRWVRRYDGPAHDYDVPASMLVDSAGRIYVAGLSWSASNGADALVVKYAQDGTRLWAKRYNGPADGDDQARALRARPDGGVYVCGDTTQASTGQDGLLLAYTTAGTRLFATAVVGFEPGTTAQAFNDLEVLPSGDVMCGGYEFYSGSSDHFYAAISPTGAVTTRAGYGTSYGEEITAMAKDGQGGVYLTGPWGTATGTQVYTRRLRVGGAEWGCYWPDAPTGDHEPVAIAVAGVNAYVVGHRWNVAEQDQIVLGHVY